MSEILPLDFKNKHSPVPETRRVGEAGEKLAVRFLIINGYRLVLANFKVPIGRNSRGASVTGEIDLLAFDEENLCFVESKRARPTNSPRPSPPLICVNSGKLPERREFTGKLSGSLQ
jgi:hypothetical protein